MLRGMHSDFFEPGIHCIPRVGSNEVNEREPRASISRLSRNRLSVKSVIPIRKVKQKSRFAAKMPESGFRGGQT
jgi:hypothetical protein